MSTIWVERSEEEAASMTMTWTSRLAQRTVGKDGSITAILALANARA